MSTKKQKNIKKSGLGRSLGELLVDNEELGNVENKVLMHKNDGTTVKIYNKVDSKAEGKGASNTANASIGDGASRALKASKASEASKSSQLSEAHQPSKAPGMNASFEPPLRITVGKTREEREEESRGIYRSGKPHVITEGETAERIRINTRPKPEPEAERIVLNGKSSGDGKSVSEALGKLKRYSPSASDEFLEALRDMTDIPQNKDYRTDKDGRIIIGATKSRVKKR